MKSPEGVCCNAPILTPLPTTFSHWLEKSWFVALWNLVHTMPAAAPAVLDPDTCVPEHCYHAFDALYCALTRGARPIPPQFPDNK